MLDPKSAREELLKRGSGSAVRSTRVRANVCTGNREGSERRAWSAESFGEFLASEMGGEGRPSRRCEGVVVDFGFDSLAGKTDSGGSLSRSEGEEEN
jgi:hypothetical protein